MTKFEYEGLPMKKVTLVSGWGGSCVGRACMQLTHTVVMAVGLQAMDLGWTK
jgi:hypothetical protein